MVFHLFYHQMNWCCQIVDVRHCDAGQTPLWTNRRKTPDTVADHRKAWEAIMNQGIYLYPDVYVLYGTSLLSGCWSEEEPFARVAISKQFLLWRAFIYAPTEARRCSRRRSTLWLSQWGLQEHKTKHSLVSINFVNYITQLIVNIYIVILGRTLVGIAVQIMCIFSGIKAYLPASTFL